MPKQLIVYLLIFVSAALLSYGVYNYYTRERKTQEKISRRISVVEVSDEREFSPAKLRRRGVDLGNFQELEDFVVQTGINMERSKLLLLLIGILAAIALTTALVFGFALVPLSAGIAAGLAAITVSLRFLRARRIGKFEQQLPDAIDVIVRSLRAGHPFPTAMSLVAKELPDPVGAEFTAAFEELTFGLDMRAVMGNLSRRVGSPDLRFLVTSVTIQSQSGGNLAEILSRLSTVMRDRAALRHKIRAMTAEARVSAVVMTMLPVGVVLAVELINPAYYGEVWDHPNFRVLLYTAGVMLFVGNLIMRQMARFKF